MGGMARDYGDHREVSQFMIVWLYETYGALAMPSGISRAEGYHWICIELAHLPLKRISCLLSRLGKYDWTAGYRVHRVYILPRLVVFMLER